ESFSILQGLESRSPKALDGGVLEEAYVLPDEQATALQEICFNHLSTLTLWTGVDVPEEGCHDVLKEVYERLEQDFAEADSSLLLKHWVDLEPNGYVWSRFCSEERLRAAQVLHIDLGSSDGWSLRRYKLISCLDSFPFFRDSAIKSQYFPDLMETTDLNQFDQILEDMAKVYSPLTLDELLGTAGSTAYGTVPSKDTKNNGRDTTRKHGQKNNDSSSEFVITLNSTFATYEFIYFGHVGWEQE
ncbi:hypothetical protein FOZ63_013919, partial [Perkinsus olseni]